MKINNEIKELFKNHKAHYRDLGEVQILDWKKDNTICESIRYIFDGSKLYISGDFGCSVYWLTWKGTPQSFKDINLGYFYEKIEAHEDEKYSFNHNKAREDIKYHMEFLFEDYNDFKESCEEEIADAKAELEELDKDSEEYKEELESLKDFIEDQEDRIKEKYESIEVQPENLPYIEETKKPKEIYLTSKLSKLNKGERKIVETIYCLINHELPKDVAEVLINKIQEELKK
jgi:hypothetical protein